MKSIEHPYGGVPWAKPFAGGELSVELIGSELRIAGLFPDLEDRNSTDLIRQHEMSADNIRRRFGPLPPDFLFANADKDEKLVAFVQTFGPVVANRFDIRPLTSSGQLRLEAMQDLQELRNEQLIYRAAVTLALQSGQKRFDEAAAAEQIKTIASHIKNWPRQWQREKLLRKTEPRWKLSASSLKRVENLSSALRDRLPAQKVDARIVLCELLNSFGTVAFPNKLEMHTSIWFGIRPLLYSLLRREFFYPRDFLICKNPACRNFFHIERAGFHYCSNICSRRHRQRINWHKNGKQNRKKHRKAKKAKSSKAKRNDDR